MDQRLTVITLGVNDIERSRRFYCEGLGWHASKASLDDLLLLDMKGVVLALYPRQLLADDARLPLGQGYGGVTISQNVRQKADVDAALKAAERAGGTILKPAQDVFWGGYSGYFADPDGHPWEVAWNPHWPLDANDRVDLPE
jgi:catechol 2,3-dioxygenase-like lactoylglutathione lyase family enzyme